MRLYDKEGHTIPAYKTRSPRFSDRNGRTWDYEVAIIDKEEYEFWLDTTWGKAWYFLYNDMWYRIPFYLHGRPAYAELDPIYIFQEGRRGTELFTKKGE